MKKLRTNSIEIDVDCTDSIMFNAETDSLLKDPTKKLFSTIDQIERMLA